ncbi:MAG TPA: hypothetical protein VFP44_03265, partial [Usitatibacter sp.]|nr:hypothetical protein [Usitatibacter sp.]
MTIHNAGGDPRKTMTRIVTRGVSPRRDERRNKNPSSFGARQMSAPSAVFRLIASIAALAAGVSFAPLTLAQWSSSTCAADRGYSSTLNCTANDIEIASVRVNNAVTSCVSGDNVTLDLTATLHINASQRYNVGVFLARDAKAPNVPAASGGSANCQVHGLPLSPSPFGDLDSNACGDIEAGTQGQSFDLNLGTITVPCLAGTSGNLVIPSVVSWDTNSGTCNAPVSEWVRP